MNPVLIVGAGLSGLACALSLQEQGVPALVVEGADGVGGRVRTEDVDGFRLDRGFQVYLTAYPEGRARLDYEELRLHAFTPGALVRTGGRFARIGDPWRRLADAPTTLAAPVGSLGDKLRLGALRLDLQRESPEVLFARPERTTAAALAERGFSEAMVGRFFRPFFGGVFFDPELETSSRQFDFLFRMFAAGDAALPEGGMEAIPRQLASRLPPGAVRLNAPVARVDGTTVTLASGERLAGSAVVVATAGDAAARLLGLEPPRPPRSGVTLSYAAREPPVREPLLVLNGEGRGLVNHLAVPSQVAPGYAPAGQALVCVNLLGRPQGADEALEAAVRAELAEWFGPAVAEWRHLRTNRIRYALPDGTPPALQSRCRPARLRPGQYVCGDWRADASIDGALLSGRRAAEAVLADLGGLPPGPQPVGRQDRGPGGGVATTSGRGGPASRCRAGG